MANKYDKILKENIQPIIPFLIKHILGLEVTQLEEMKDKLQVTMEREADFIQKVKTGNPLTDYIIQIEFQVKNEKDLKKRMLLYYAILYNNHGIPIKQFIVYIGEAKKPGIKNTVKHDDLSYRFTALNLQDFDVELFLTSDKPEEILLAILANFGNNKPEDVIRRILNRIQDIIGKEIKLQKYARQLQILSMLRKLQPQTNKIIQDMALTFDIREDVVYQQGYSDAEVKKDTATVTNMLLNSNLTIAQIANFSGTTEEFVKKIKKNLTKKQVK
ncbi:MAG: hypothetical protein RLZZ292_2142 [Bacteroidota bacterium]|jgi:hypothetical protein